MAHSSTTIKGASAAPNASPYASRFGGRPKAENTKTILAQIVPVFLTEVCQKLDDY